MFNYGDNLFGQLLDESILLIVDRDKGQSDPPSPITSPLFSRGRSAPKLKTFLYHLFMALGIICIAIVIGGMFGMLLRVLTFGFP
jgi:hypothetical protein